MRFQRVFGMVLGLVVGVVASASEGPLRLLAEVEGEWLPLTQVGINRVIAERGGGSLPVPLTAPFRIDGDVRANAAQVYWSPVYSLVCVPLRAGVAPRRRWFANVQLVQNDKRGDVMNRLWADGSAEGALVVLGWATRDAIAVRWVKAISNTRWFDIEECLPVEGGADAGVPVVLLWRHGGFVSPRGRFSTPGSATAICDALLDHEALRPRFWEPHLSPKSWGPDGATLLHFAAEGGNEAAVRELLKHGAALNAQTRSGATPLEWALNNGRTRVVEQLLAAAPAGKGLLVPPAVLVRGLIGGHEEAVQRLLEHGGRLFDRGDKAKALPYAIDQGFVDVAESLASSGLRLNFAAPEAEETLIIHAERGDDALVRWLLAHGVKAGAERRGRTALVAAAERGTRALAEMLCAGGAAANQPDGAGMRPLAVACAAGNLEFARVLLAAGADPDAPIPGDHSTLGFALLRSPEAVELLLERGVRLDVPARRGILPLELALQAGARDCVDQLVRRGARIDLKSPGAAAALELALLRDVPELLLRAREDGWDAGMLFQGRWTACEVARLGGATRCEAALAATAPAIGTATTVVWGASDVDAVAVPIDAAMPPDWRAIDQRRMPGEVTLGVVVDEQGLPMLIQPGRASHVALAHAAALTVQGWKFRPALREEKPVVAWKQLRFTFPASASLPHKPAQLDAAPMRIGGAPLRVSPSFQTSEEGTRNLHFALTIDATGKVESMSLLGRGALDERISQLVQATVFTPGVVDGQCVRSALELWWRY